MSRLEEVDNLLEVRVHNLECSFIHDLWKNDEQDLQLVGLELPLKIELQ